MIKVDNDLILSLAHLARLHIGESDLAAYGEKLTDIIDMLDLVNGIDVGSKPMAHPMDLPQPLRADTTMATEDIKALQSIAPKTHSNLYLTPKVIDSN